MILMMNKIQMIQMKVKIYYYNIKKINKKIFYINVYID